MQSLEGAGKILDNLMIRAPIDGQLSRPQLDPGQSVNIGQRLGWIDVVGSYKVKVPIDELYLPRITTGLHATTTFNNKDYELEITYKYPGATNGRFEVDMNFVGELPPGIIRGLSLRLRIELGSIIRRITCYLLVDFTKIQAVTGCMCWRMTVVR